MKFKIKNFGPINKAEIDIGKINIIAGQNASGKTTSSKLFYCLLASVSPDGTYLLNESIKDRLRSFINKSFLKEDNKFRRNELFNLAENLFNYMDNYEILAWNNDFYNDFNAFLRFSETENFNEKELKELREIFNIMFFDRDLLFNETLDALLDIEFDQRQIYENCDNSFIKMSGKQNCYFEVKINIPKDVAYIWARHDYLKCIEVNEVSYVETPYILDFLSEDIPFYVRKSNINHQQLLLRKLKDQKKGDVFDKRFNENIIKFQKIIQKKIKEIVGGNVKFDTSSAEFIFEQENNTFSSKNVATGIKTLGILQMLLENRKLPENSYLIIDEPEVHLHPEWQVKLAEILVLLARDLNVTLYVNSHSPHFIEAIEVYSEHHNIKEDTNFYLTEEAKNGKFNINKIDRNRLMDIYNCLGKPYEDIDEIRGKIDAKHVIEGRD